MNATPMAIYARVSTEQQAETHTIASQVAALRERVAADGLAGSAALEFLDEGYSGATLVRPALERLRDVVAAGSVDRLYVHSPDRLARKYAYQVLLVDEFRRAGVEVIFLNRALGQSPEDDLLLQVQGMIAEYERAKIIERHRRGKRHAARAGGVNVLSGAPYGYRYVSKYAGGGQARYDIIPEEARVVRQVFDWIARDRLTIGEVCRRLTQAGEVTRTGKTAWDRSVLWGMLKNPAYIGNAAFGKTRQEPLRPRLRAQRGRPPAAAGRLDRGCAPGRSSPSPSLPSSSPTCLPLSGNNFGRINVTRGNRAAVRCISCRSGAVPAVAGYAYYGKPQPGAGRQASRVRVLPLPGDGCVSLWRRARLSEYPGPDGSAGPGRLAGSRYVAGPPGATCGGISAPLATGHLRKTYVSCDGGRADRQAAARGRTRHRQLRGGAHRQARI